MVYCYRECIVRNLYACIERPVAQKRFSNKLKLDTSYISRSQINMYAEVLLLFFMDIWITNINTFYPHICKTLILNHFNAAHGDLNAHV